MSVRLLGAAEIRRLAEELGLRPTKKLGQNFVHDPGTVRRIVAIAGIQPGEHVLEVGPGLGSLSLGLLEAGAQLTAIEIDPRLAGRLPETVRERAPGARLRVLEQDALRVTRLPRGSGPAEPGGLPVALVANLPYNVSVPVLLHLLDRLPELRRGVVMVQAEVGERLAAGPGAKAYGAPSVKAAWYGRWSLAGRVGRSVFWPVPNVDSVLVAYRARPEPVGEGTLRERVFELVDAAFGQRRKMLRRSLAGVLGGAEAAAAVLAAAGIEPSARGEALELDGFLRIARAAGAA